MTNCKCGNPLRKGESECDWCLLSRHELLVITYIGESLGGGDDKYCIAKDVAKALRMAETAWKNGGYHDVDEFYKE